MRHYEPALCPDQFIEDFSREDVSPSLRWYHGLTTSNTLDLLLDFSVIIRNNLLSREFRVPWFWTCIRGHNFPLGLFCALCISASVLWTHIFILISEMRSCGLVQSHDHCHHVFAVEDGRSQDTLGLVFCEFVDKWTEVLALKRQKAYTWN